MTTQPTRCRWRRKLEGSGVRRSPFIADWKIRHAPPPQATTARRIRSFFIVGRVPCRSASAVNLPKTSAAHWSCLIVDQGLSLEWDGPDFDVSQFPDNGPLLLYAHEVAWGRMDDLEGFCVENGLPFVRWSGGYSGQFGPERAVFTGSGEVTLYAADEEEFTVMSRTTAERLGSYDAILAHFAVADFQWTPLHFGP
jgi:hypothetical protein